MIYILVIIAILYFLRKVLFSDGGFLGNIPENDWKQDPEWYKKANDSADSAQNQP